MRETASQILAVSVFCFLTSGASSAVGQSAGPTPVASKYVAPSQAGVPQPLTTEERADIFMARKAYADAVDLYARALKQAGSSTKPESFAGLCNKMGIAYQQQMEFGLARRAYKDALHYNKDFPEAWNNLGTTYFLANKFGKSVKYYRHALVLKPDAPSFHLNLGTSYYRMKKYQEAVDEYRSALTLDPQILTERSNSAGTVVQARGADVDYFFYMAKVFASLGRNEEAIRYLRRAFEDGFDNIKLLDRDPDFLKISKDPAYVALRTNPPIAIKD